MIHRYTIMNRTRTSDAVHQIGTQSARARFICELRANTYIVHSICRIRFCIIRHYVCAIPYAHAMPITQKLSCDCVTFRSIIIIFPVPVLPICSVVIKFIQCNRQPVSITQPFHSVICLYGAFYRFTKFVYHKSEHLVYLEFS